MHSQSPNTFTLSLKSVWNSSLINYLDRANCGNRGALSKIRASAASDFAQRSPISEVLLSKAK